MPIVAGDIHIRLSGAASLEAAQADPNASLGSHMASNQAGSTIFDNVSAAESAAGDIEYRCVYVKNTHATLTLSNAKVWIQAQAAQGDGIAIALGGEGVNGTAETVANENTAPAGETFSSPTTQGSGLSLGNLAPGDRYPIWIRRDVNAGAAAQNDGFTLRIGGDTLP